MKRTVLRYGLTALLMAAAPIDDAAADYTVHLLVKRIWLSMPDGTQVRMWAFAQDDLNPATPDRATVPGPTIRVPPGETRVHISVTNYLADPISVVIPGQTATFQPRWVELDAAGAVTATYDSRPEGNTTARLRSMTAETPSRRTTVYTWDNFKPGSYIYHSGTHPAVQVPMGLYGAIIQDAAAPSGGDPQAYDGLSYRREVPVFYSEIDPALHDAIENGTYGPGKAMTSTIDYSPRFFLVNGRPRSSQWTPLDTLTANEPVLFRFFNAGLTTHFPTISDGHLRVIAEDGNPYPYPRNLSTVGLPAGKTLDALYTPLTPGMLVVYDRGLALALPDGRFGGYSTFLRVTAP